MNFSALRQAVRDRAMSTPSTELVDSKEVYAHWRRSGRSPVHQEICIGVPSSSPVDPSRQKPGVGQMVTEDVLVGISFQLRAAEDREVDGDALLDLEQKVRNHLLINWSQTLRMTWTNSDRNAGPDGWLYSEIQFKAYHFDTLS